MAEQVKAADAPAPALSFGNFADKVASPSGGFNFKAPEFNTGNQGLFGARRNSARRTRRRATRRRTRSRAVRKLHAVEQTWGARHLISAQANRGGAGVDRGFTPVVQLDEVEVKTHEEDEDVDFKIRAKLFRFSETLLNKGSGKKEWMKAGGVEK